MRRIARRKFLCGVALVGPTICLAVLCSLFFPAPARSADEAPVIRLHAPAVPPAALTDMSLPRGTRLAHPHRTTPFQHLPRRASACSVERALLPVARPEGRSFSSPGLPRRPLARQRAAPRDSSPSADPLQSPL